MVGIVAITAPPAQGDEIIGLLRLCADPELAKKLAEHQEAWEEVYRKNGALLKKASKIKDLDAAKETLDAKLAMASTAEANAKRIADETIAGAKSKAAEIESTARHAFDGLDERNASLDARVSDLDAVEAALVEREKKVARAEAAVDKEKERIGMLKKEQANKLSMLNKAIKEAG